MTLLLGLIACALLIAVIAASIQTTRDDEVVGFTRPGDLAAATRAASTPSPLLVNTTSTDIAPSAVAEVSIERVLADKQAEASLTFSLGSFLPGNLGVGTSLTYSGVESVIFGVISFESGGILWQDYLAEHTSGQWWRFGVEPDQGMKLAAFEPQSLGVEPGPDAIEYDGDTFRVTELGQANYRSAGRTDQFETGRYRYFDYENDAKAILSFERFDDGPWLSSIGHHVDPFAVTVCNALPDHPV